MKMSGPTTNEALELLSERFTIPAISVAFFGSDGRIIKNFAGFISKEQSQKITDQTLFEAASLSKPVFAYIVLKMAERGEIDLDVPLLKQLKRKFGKKHPAAQFGPEEPGIRNHTNYKKLTARMLLSHQAGLPNEFAKPVGPPEFKFICNAGKTFDYSGEAYRFLMEVIEKLAFPITIEDMAQAVFKNLEMTHSSFIRPERTDDLAVGHYANGDMDLRQHFFGIHPAASLHTTPEDYAKFLLACMSDVYISAQIFKPMIDLAGTDTKSIDLNMPTKVLEQISWGLGIGLQKNRDGSMTAFHWGDGSGTCRNFAAINLNTHQAVACFSNSANGPAVFKQICEPIVGDLSLVFQWLAKRENLPTTAKAIRHMKQKDIQDNLSLEMNLTTALDLHKAKHKPKNYASHSGMRVDISDEEMAKSAFGQSSHTAKKIKHKK